MRSEEERELLIRLDEKAGEILRRLDTINGRLRTAEMDIGKLKVRDAYVAGAAAGFMVLVKLLWG